MTISDRDAAALAENLGLIKPTYSISEGTDALGLRSRTTTYSLIRSGELATFMIGARRVIDRLALARCIASLRDRAA